MRRPRSHKLRPERELSGHQSINVSMPARSLRHRKYPPGSYEPADTLLCPPKALIGSLCAAAMAADPDDIRGLNPIHIDELDALTEPRVCSIPGLDRFASRHNHPSQAEKLFDPLAGPEFNSLRGNGDRNPIIFLLGEQRPGDPRRFVGDSNRNEPSRLLLEQRVDPSGTDRALFAGVADHRRGSDDNERGTQIAVAHLRDAAKTVLSTR